MYTYTDTYTDAYTDICAGIHPSADGGKSGSREDVMPCKEWPILAKISEAFKVLTSQEGTLIPH